MPPCYSRRRAPSKLWFVIVRAVLGVVVGVGLLASAAVGTWPSNSPDTASLVPRPADAQPMVVREVLSGDTVVLVNERLGPQVPGSGLVTARLIGIDSPNFGLMNECFAIEAQGRLRDLLPKGSIAWVATDSLRRDANGRWLMYVWGADGRLANYLMAVDGYVRVESTPPNTRLDEVLTEAERKARAQFGGMWSMCLD